MQVLGWPFGKGMAISLRHSGTLDDVVVVVYGVGLSLEGWGGGH